MKISLYDSLIICFFLFLHSYILNPHRIKPLPEQNISIENNNIFKCILQILKLINSSEILTKL
jgi:hypothetical protein